MSRGRISRPQAIRNCWEDEELKNRFVALRHNKKRTEAEEKEFKEVGEEFAALLTVDTGLMSSVIVDMDLRLPAERL